LLSNPAAPYLNSLITPGNPNAQDVSYASNYTNTGNGVHPSEPNYIWAEAGTNYNPATNTTVLSDDDPSASAGNIFTTTPHLTGLMNAAGISWQNYQEDYQVSGSGPLVSASGTLPGGATNPYNGSTLYNYAVKHNPMAFFTDSDTENLYAMSQLTTNLANNTVGRYNWITPDMYNEMHSYLPSGFTYHGTHYTSDQAAVAEGDNFLSIVVPEIEASQAFKNDGMIIITSDETEGGDTSSFTIPEIMISPLAKGNAYDSTVALNHSSDLKTMQEIFQLGPSFLNNSIPTSEYNVNGPGNFNTVAGSNDLSDLFQAGVIPAGFGPANLTWNNASGNNLWDTATSSNWNNGTATAMFHAQDNVTFNDSNAGNYAVTLNTIVSPGSVIANNSSGNYTISGAGGIGGTGALTKSGSGTLALSTPNTYSGGTNVSGGLLEILPTSSTTSALPKGALSISGGEVQLAANVTQGSQSSNTPVTAPTSNVNLTSLSITGNGTLDIGNNHIIINYGGGPDPIASIAAEIANAAFGSAVSVNWTGTGITSSAAAANSNSYGIGYADSADPGNPAGLTSGTIEIMYTLLGDANLDGKVNGTDFAILATHFNQAVTNGWDQGDFNYDGSVNGSDLLLLAANFNKSANQSAVAGDDLAALDSFAAANGISLTSVPEPASAGMMVMAGLGILRRRRRLHA
jgi:autotransporter-associated beta strand protein